MSVLVAILLALSAVLATPETESPRFVLDILTMCQPVSTQSGFTGCELPVPAYAPDETGYAGWSQGDPLTGP